MAGAAVIVLAIAALYFWTAASSPDGRNLHLLLAQAFENGQTSLPIDPPAELLALDDPYDPAQNTRTLGDPYDPAQNGAYRINDASLYEDKWYLYFGPAPAALLFLPLRAIGEDLTDNLAAPLFAAGAYACAAALLLFLIGRYLPRTPTAWRLVAVAGLGLGNLVLFMLRRPEVYETSIAAGQFFLMAAILLLVLGAMRASPSLALIALGSLSLGLAVGSRANLTLAAPLLVWAWWRALGPRAGWRRGAAIRTAAAAAGPFAACLLGLAYYNVLRFGSPTEFGLSYQLGGLNSRELDFFSVSRLVPGAWFYLVQPPSFGWDFPFITAAPDYPGSLPGDYGVEPVAGVLTIIPILLALVAAPFIVSRWRDRAGRELLTLSGVLLGVALAALLLPVLTLPGATMRLLVDTSTLLMVLAILAWLWLADRMRSSPGRRRLILAAGATALAYGAVVNLAFGVSGYENGLRSGSPETFFQLERGFSWIPTLAAKAGGEPLVLEVGGDGTNAEIQFASPGPGVVEFEADFIPNPLLPPRSVVRILVAGTDGVVRRFPLVAQRTVVAAGLKDRGLQAVRIRLDLVRYGTEPPPPGAPPPGQGLADLQVVGWTPR